MMTGDGDEDGRYSSYLSWSDYPLGDRHNKMANVAFFDGHVESVISSQWNVPGLIQGTMSMSGANLTMPIFFSGYNWTNVPVKLLYFWGSWQNGGIDYYTCTVTPR
jgi:prepilin-type processing-associated H-X9-DG protein